ncbi:DUF3035 domain-containing protein [bacterium]|nr:DUF3035 domain-containing protein [bacterium]
MNKKTAFIICAVLPLVLTGCDDTKRALGFSKRAPDEFKVLTNPPLSMPEAYDLRAPRPGELGPTHEETVARAQKALTGTSGTASDGLSGDEEALLSKAGAAKSSDNIRLQLLKEQGKDEKTDSLWTKFKEGRLLVDNPNGEVKGDTIDPKKEASKHPETSPDIEKRPEGYIDPENDPTKLAPPEDSKNFGFGVFNKKPKKVDEGDKDE